MKTTLILQDIVLNQVRRDKVEVIVKTVNNEEIVGKVRGFDNQTIILDVNNDTQVLIYKSAVISVTPPKPVLTDEKQSQLNGTLI